MSVVHVYSEADFSRLVNDKKFEVSIIDFTATWCGPCQAIKPFYEELASKNTDIQFLKVDIDEQEKIASEHEISAVPTFIVYKNGAKTNQKLSGANQSALEDLVKKNKKITSEFVPEVKTQNQQNKKTKKCTCSIL